MSGMASSNQDRLTAQVRDDVRRYIVDELLGEEAPDELDAHTPLLSSGVVDSVALEQLLFYLEERYGLALEDADLSVERFETIERIAAMVVERLGGDGAAGLSAPS